jgi:hypothetical protein
VRHFEFEGHYERYETVGLAKSSTEKQRCELDCFDANEKMGLNKEFQQDLII